MSSVDGGKKKKKVVAAKTTFLLSSSIFGGVIIRWVGSHQQAFAPISLCPQKVISRIVSEESTTG